MVVPDSLIVHTTTTPCPWQQEPPVPAPSEAVGGPKLCRMMGRHRPISGARVLMQKFRVVLGLTLALCSLLTSILTCDFIKLIISRRCWELLILPRCFMVLEYWPTFIPKMAQSCRCAYSSTMEHLAWSSGLSWNIPHQLQGLPRCIWSWAVWWGIRREPFR
jgi:hypothetical protein